MKDWGAGRHIESEAIPAGVASHARSDGSDQRRLVGWQPEWPRILPIVRPWRSRDRHQSCAQDQFHGRLWHIMTLVGLCAGSVPSQNAVDEKQRGHKRHQVESGTIDGEGDTHKRIFWITRKRNVKEYPAKWRQNAIGQDMPAE